MRQIVMMLFGWCLSTVALAADLTGHWILDSGASQTIDAVLALQEVSWAKRKAAEYLDNDATITQSGSRVVVRFSSALGTIEQVLVLDGQPHDTVNPAGIPTRFTSSWQGENLVSRGVVRDSSGTEGSLTEVRTLSADGNTMTLLVTAQIGEQSASVRRVFRRMP